MKDLEKLYTEIQPKIYAFFYIKTMNQSLAEDLTQDVFYQALKGIHSFSGKSTLKTWVFSIAKNRLKTYYRSKKYMNSLHEKLVLEDPPSLSASPEELYISKEEESQFLKRLERLADLPREIMILRLYGELSFKEIGELVNKSENYTRLAFHRAKLQLQKEMRVNNE
ncbi:RNA polymerase sigma factor [Bacillus niameyensis]|uniref:RNA polymerase sigma factor n=1 Tax=Bacillus niameyensis TaxID=1522308 RepID=UPI000785F080|nr:RNA polymerase sigma factor [Bacillus niameyensis]